VLHADNQSRTAVAHLIREQIQAHQKSLNLAGGLAGFMADEELRSSLLPSLSSGARTMDQVSSFTPQLNYVSDDEIEKSEKEREKEATRRRKRNTRARRGPAMPDREPLRTYRTPGIGFPPVDPANMTAQMIINAPTSRRAAAAAAQINISNMVAAENRPEDMDPGTGLTPVMMHSHLPNASAAAAAPKKDKEPAARGLFKAPPCPPSVLLPRATVDTPTESTAFGKGFMLPHDELDAEPPASMINVSSRPDGSRVPKPKSARDLEKEQEYIDGQHQPMIGGVWHCSNCGCPESIAIGRRKGPLGEKTQCGMCGTCLLKEYPCVPLIPGSR
jgi:SWI/SNF-related matrix-associated actin-dependent regulator of chromatin subfamily B protein 1